MHDRADGLDTAFLTAASIALELIRQPDVSEQWNRPSALPKLSVGALACHLGSQPLRVAELLATNTDIAPLSSADEHYGRAAWVRSSSPDDPINDRSVDEAEAALGDRALHNRVAAAVRAVQDLLASGAASEVILIPWQGWSLRRDDFLLTRLVEIVVHSDDLAHSVGIATPQFPEDVFAPVGGLLMRLAVRRHGQHAVISTLTRRERAQAISAF